MTQGMPPTPCKLPPPGWFCTRAAGHAGPCAAYETAVPADPLQWPDDPAAAPRNLKRHWTYHLGTGMVLLAALIAAVGIVAWMKGAGR